MFTEEVATCATDEFWRCYVNPHFFSRLSADEGAMVLVHETWHVLLEHSERARSQSLPMSEIDRWGIAADIEINQHDDLYKRLPADPPPLTPKFSFTTKSGKKVGWDFPANLTAEEYFRLLAQHVPPSKAQVIGGDSEGDGDGEDRPKCGVCAGKCGSAAHGQGGGYELPEPGTLDKNGNRTLGVAPARAEMIKQETARSIQEAAQSRGNVPAGWQRWAKKQLKSKIDWKSQIRPTIQGMVIAKGGHYYPDYKRPARRQHLYGDIIRPSYKDILPRVAMIIDTSGSMRDSWVGQGLAEVDGVLKDCPCEVAVYFTDAAAATAQKVTSAEKLIPFGGGGTDMREGFAAIARDAAACPEERPSVIICITDGYTPWPDHPPRDTMVVTVLVANGEQPPWAGGYEHPLIRVTPDDPD